MVKQNSLLIAKTVGLNAVSEQPEKFVSLEA